MARNKCSPGISPTQSESSAFIDPHSGFGNIRFPNVLMGWLNLIAEHSHWFFDLQDKCYHGRKNKRKSSDIPSSQVSISIILPGTSSAIIELLLIELNKQKQTNKYRIISVNSKCLTNQTFISFFIMFN